MKRESPPVVIIGFGSQARAWAYNLRDSSRNVVMALRENSKSISDVQGAAFDHICLGNALGDYRYFALLAPDHAHLEILQNHGSCLPDNALIVLAHGQSFVKDRLGERFPRLNFALLAPKSIAGELRRQFQQKGPLGACFSLEGVQTDKAEHRTFILDLAKDLGVTLGPYEVSFREEAYADIFSEQSLLCSLLPYGALHSYNKLREKGHSPEVAYMECWLELKLIVDTMVSLGPRKFFDLISPTALAGGEKAHRTFFDQKYFVNLEKLYQDVANGCFFKELDQTNFAQTKQDVIAFWKDQELVKVHEKMKDTM